MSSTVPTPRRPAEVEPATFDQIRDAAEQLRQVHARVHAATEVAVRAGRLAGMSWATIARRLGVSRQACHERWRYLDDYGVVVMAGGFRCAVTGLEFQDLDDLHRVIDHVAGHQLQEVAT